MIRFTPPTTAPIRMINMPVDSWAVISEVEQKVQTKFRANDLVYRHSFQHWVQIGGERSILHSEKLQHILVLPFNGTPTITFS